jgi:hypothetical protein
MQNRYKGRCSYKLALGGDGKAAALEERTADDRSTLPWLGYHTQLHGHVSLLRNHAARRQKARMLPSTSGLCADLIAQYNLCFWRSAACE